MEWWAWLIIILIIIFTVLFLVYFVTYSRMGVETVEDYSSGRRGIYNRR